MENKRQRQQALQHEIIKKINGEPLIEITDEDLKLMDEINNNIQTKTTWWTETKLWAVSSIFFITFLTLAYFYPMIALAICLIALGALFLYVLVWLGTLLLKEILGLDDNE